MEKRFNSLHVIGRLLRIIGAAEMVIAAISLILIPLVMSGSDAMLQELFPKIAVPGSGMVTGTILGVVVFILGIAAGLLTYAAGELFKLLLAIEENTRALRRQQENQK
ncbi:MAG: hypothetical protein KBF64_07805 [Anaerolineaceae bacterium]|nr:hypothetical protein [Anaerolineaceae bacterium]